LQSGQAGGAAVLYPQFEAACVADSLDRRRGKYRRPAVLKRGKASLHFGPDGKTVLFGEDAQAVGFTVRRRVYAACWKG